MATLTKSTAVKFLELILIIVLLVIHYNDNQAGLGSYFLNLLAMGTFGGYLIILIGVFAGAFMGSAIGRHTDLFFSIVGLALFLIIGIVVISNNATWKGIACIVTGVIFLVDAIFTFRGEN